MKPIASSLTERSELSNLAKSRLRQNRGEPLFIADWDAVLMIHFEVDAAALQSDVPFELDLFDARAFVTVVTFAMRNMRPAFGGRLTCWMFQPIATHDFLNVRTYVRVNGESGIHFLSEWVSSRLAVAFGPRTFSLPYRFGNIDYHNDWRTEDLSGRVRDAQTGAAFEYQAELEPGAGFMECGRDSLDEWLMERYTAFNAACGRKKFFRVWHESWLQRPARMRVVDASLLEVNWKWFAGVEPMTANYSPGVRGVWLGRPHRIKSPR